MPRHTFLSAVAFSEHRYSVANGGHRGLRIRDCDARVVKG